MPEREPSPEQLEHSLKRAAAALREAGVPFMVGGSLAAWVRGGPPTRKDLDLMLKPTDVRRATVALEGAGMRIEKPPEDWLCKAWDDDVLIDLIFHAKGLEIDDAALQRADVADVFAVPVRVMALEDMLVTKLLVLDEHTLDLEPLLQIARSVRERIDWDEVRTRTAESPYARAFFTLVEELGIVEAPALRPGTRRSRVRVVGAPASGGNGGAEGREQGSDLRPTP